MSLSKEDEGEAPAINRLGAHIIFRGLSDLKARGRARRRPTPPLLETLGERQVATLAERGAGLETADALAYLRAEADQVLHEE